MAQDNSSSNLQTPDPIGGQSQEQLEQYKFDRSKFVDDNPDEWIYKYRDRVTGNPIWGTGEEHMNRAIGQLQYSKVKATPEMLERMGLADGASGPTSNAHLDNEPPFNMPVPLSKEMKSKYGYDRAVVSAVTLNSDGSQTFNVSYLKPGEVKSYGKVTETTSSFGTSIIRTGDNTFEVPIGGTMQPKIPFRTLSGAAHFATALGEFMKENDGNPNISQMRDKFIAEYETPADIAQHENSYNNGSMVQQTQSQFEKLGLSPAGGSKEGPQSLTLTRANSDSNLDYLKIDLGRDVQLAPGNFVSIQPGANQGHEFDRLTTDTLYYNRHSGEWSSDDLTRHSAYTEYRPENKTDQPIGGQVYTYFDETTDLYPETLKPTYSSPEEAYKAMSALKKEQMQVKADREVNLQRKATEALGETYVFEPGMTVNELNEMSRIKGNIAGFLAVSSDEDKNRVLAARNWEELQAANDALNAASIAETGSPANGWGTTIAQAASGSSPKYVSTGNEVYEPGINVRNKFDRTAEIEKRQQDQVLSGLAREFYSTTGNSTTRRGHSRGGYGEDDDRSGRRSRRYGDGGGGDGYRFNSYKEGYGGYRNGYERHLSTVGHQDHYVPGTKTAADLRAEIENFEAENPHLVPTDRERYEEYIATKEYVLDRLDQMEGGQTPAPSDSAVSQQTQDGLVGASNFESQEQEKARGARAQAGSQRRDIEAHPADLFASHEGFNHVLSAHGKNHDDFQDWLKDRGSPTGQQTSGENRVTNQGQPSSSYVNARDLPPSTNSDFTRTLSDGSTIQGLPAELSSTGVDLPNLSSEDVEKMSGGNISASQWENLSSRFGSSGGFTPEKWNKIAERLEQYGDFGDWMQKHQAQGGDSATRLRTAFSPDKSAFNSMGFGTSGSTTNNFGKNI